MTHRRASCRVCAPSTVPSPGSAAVAGRSVARSCVRNAPRYGNLVAQLEHMDRADAAERMARRPTCQGWNTARTQPAVSAVA